jgi:hypothetical protein
VVVVVVAVAACSNGSAVRPAKPLIATAEKQGSFSTPCTYSHSAADDPIVHAGHHGISHMHDFFGATTTDAASTATGLLEDPTTCRSVDDHSAYWSPALSVGGQVVPPADALAYYRVPVGADATRMTVPPNGLEMIAGDSTATSPQSTDVVSWRCGFGDTLSAVPVHCPAGTDLFLRLVFDPCWNGSDLGAADHRSHLAPLGADGSCPDSHPVLVPELTLDIRYPTAGDIPVGDFTLASGPVTGGHGDAVMAWENAFITREVDTCLQANLRCDVVSEASRLEVDDVPH